MVQSLLQIKLGERSLPQVQEALNRDHKIPEGALIETALADGDGDGEGDGEGEGEGERRGVRGTVGAERDRVTDVRLGVDAAGP